jgi:hypothetical protein
MGIGLNGTTPVVVTEIDGKFEARVGIALFGSTNMTEEQMDAADRNPFSDRWMDNFCRGTGATKEEAIAALEKDFDSLYESIWD